jgi:hypothetical protein
MSGGGHRGKKGTVLMKTTMLALVLGAVTAAGGWSVSADAMPAAALRTAASENVVQVWHRGRAHRVYRHYPQRVIVYPEVYGYPYASPYAYYRGFEDPGFAVRGNIPGNCAVDLGYGRWETCDK